MDTLKNIGMGLFGFVLMILFIWLWLQLGLYLYQYFPNLASWIFGIESVELPQR